VDHVHPPVVADGVVYLSFLGYDREEFERLLAFDATTGEERWRRETSGGGHPYTPAVARETVYWLAESNRRLALNAADGSVRWERAGANHRPPIPAHGVLLDVAGSSTDPRLVARDPDTGAPYWRRGNEGDWRLLGADEERFYVRLETRGEDEAARLYAVDPQTGETRWAADRVAPSLEPVVAGGRRVFGADERLVALDTASGEEEWSVARYVRRSSEDDEIDGVRTVVARTDETLLVHVEFNGFYNDRIEAWDPATGDVRWTYVDGSDEPVSFGRPVIAGDGVYLTAVTDRRGDGHLSGSLRTLSLTDGTERERVSLKAPSFVGPVVAGGRCLVVTRDEERRLSLVVRE
jgi:outer membrane protein assembly factor BamB